MQRGENVLYRTGSDDEGTLLVMTAGRARELNPGRCRRGRAPAGGRGRRGAVCGPRGRSAEAARAAGALPPQTREARPTTPSVHPATRQPQNGGGKQNPSRERLCAGAASCLARFSSAPGRSPRRLAPLPPDSSHPVLEPLGLLSPPVRHARTPTPHPAPRARGSGGAGARLRRSRGPRRPVGARLGDEPSPAGRRSVSRLWRLKRTRRCGAGGPVGQRGAAARLSGPARPCCRGAS
ncbi:PREDICTED: uncharacterized protein LOC106802285 [Ceratotherium simum simum]|uniref:Uncharacterized protein LOC106802285 n=1 Tax=Ceratotherium simum simum TaxID=73337 RepID=A0ABM1D0E7_CERSS|nr:PREDICTED: uncharacterized protein LOC106802285 [Ceratotherium simum simum]